MAPAGRLWRAGRAHRESLPPATAVRGWLRLLAWCLAAVLPAVALAFWLFHALGWLAPLLLSFALGGRALRDHGQRVADDLAAGDLAAARARMSRLDGVAAIPRRSMPKACRRQRWNPCWRTATTPSSAPSSGSCCWAVPAPCCSGLANTLDAMWGYRNARFLHFGAAAAPPRRRAELPAGTTHCIFLTRSSAAPPRAGLLACAGAGWDSPNAGPVMAASAGALLGFPWVARLYHGQRSATDTGRRPCRLRCRISAARCGWCASVCACGCCWRWLSAVRLQSAAAAGIGRGMLEHGGRLRLAATGGGIPLADWVDFCRPASTTQAYPVPPLAPDCWRRLPEGGDGLEAMAAACYGNARLLALPARRRRSSYCRSCCRAPLSPACRRSMKNTRRPGKAPATACAGCKCESGAGAGFHHAERPALQPEQPDRPPVLRDGSCSPPPRSWLTRRHADRRRGLSATPPLSTASPMSPAPGRRRT